MGCGDVAYLGDIRCPPYQAPDAYRDSDGNGNPLSIMARVADAERCAQRWRWHMDTRQPFDATLRAAANMARAIDSVARAVADSVACGNDSLSE